jgi:hypothetical protein
MEIVQTYDTLLIDRETGLEAQLGAAPASLVSEPITPDLLGSLGLTVIDGFPLSFLPHAIAAGLASESPDAARAFIEQLANSPSSLYSEAPFVERRNLLEFAHHVAFANVVPIEESPLHEPRSRLSRARRPESVLVPPSASQSPVPHPSLLSQFLSESSSAPPPLRLGPRRPARLWKP